MLQTLPIHYALGFGAMPQDFDDLKKQFPTDTLLEDKWRQLHAKLHHDNVTLFAFELSSHFGKQDQNTFSIKTIREKLSNIFQSATASAKTEEDLVKYSTLLEEHRQSYPPEYHAFVELAVYLNDGPGLIS